MSARGKHAGRTTPTPGAAAAALRVTVHLDAAKRGVVIGAQGAAVKETQRATGALVRTPKRGVPGPAQVSGPDALSVLRACCLIARQTAAASDCTCEVAGAVELRATMRPTSLRPAQHILFEASPNAATDFVAYVLPACAVSEQRVAAAVDDARFASGASTLPCWSAAAGHELFLYALGEGAAVARALYARLSPAIEAAAEAVPEVARQAGGAAEAAAAAPREPLPWHAVLLQGSLASGGEDHGMVEAALRGKLGLGPAAKQLRPAAREGEQLCLVDGALLEQLDALQALSRRARAPATVAEEGGRTCTAWVYRSVE